MKRSRRKFSASFKAKVAIKAIKEHSRLHDLTDRFELNPNQISNWIREFLEIAELAFGLRAEKEDPESETSSLYCKIGQLQVENDFSRNPWGNEHY